MGGCLTTSEAKRRRREWGGHIQGNPPGTWEGGKEGPMGRRPNSYPLTPGRCLVPSPGPLPHAEALPCQLHMQNPDPNPDSKGRKDPLNRDHV